MTVKFPPANQEPTADPLAGPPPVVPVSQPGSEPVVTPAVESAGPSGPLTIPSPAGDGNITPGSNPAEGGSAPPEASPVSEADAAALLAAYPVAKLNKLEELISNTRWVIPVLPKAELEALLDASIHLAQLQIDHLSEPCQRFYREGLLVSFTKIMTDEAVSSWRVDIHKCILKNCERLIELCVIKLLDPNFPLLDLLGLVLNPSNKFHLYNAATACESEFSQGAQIDSYPPTVFAKPIDVRQPRGWLVDLLNLFGHFGGFDRLLERFQNEEGLTVPLMHVLIRPFGLCGALLTPETLVKYFLPIGEAVPKFLESLSDGDLKKEIKMESKNDTLSVIIKSLKTLVSIVPNQDEMVRTLESFRLKMILRQLQISSFGGKMNALNEVNRVITSITYCPQQRHPSVDEEDFLTADRMAAWLKENKVLQIVLQDSLHQPQYVEKLEKVIRFIIKEKTLSLEDLDDIWAAQAGQHEAIVKNVHELLAKLAWDFSPEQLDHLFDCFQNNWTTASPKPREKLLELIRRLAEDDKDGVMAEKVLNLFWNLAHSDDTSTDLLDQALAAHVKILDYSCTQYRDSQKNRWLDRCIEELKTSKTWVLPALKQIQEICCLYQESPANAPHAQRAPTVTYRHEIINKLQSNHALVILVADNLTSYMDEVRKSPKKIIEGNPLEFLPDGRYNHIAQVQERLNFLRFLLKDGQLWLCAPQAKQIWTCLAENSVFPHDRDACFKWFSKLMGEEPDLDPEINRDFFENDILQLAPALMTASGIKCFDRFFKAVNCKEGKLILKRRTFQMDDLELIGLDYIWRLVYCQDEEIASKAIDLLKETFTNLGPKLLGSQVDIHEDFISSCFDRLRASYDTISILDQKDSSEKFQQEHTRLCRVLKVLQKYIMECDIDYGEERRTLIPLYRASRGKQLSLSIRFPNQSRQIDDVDIWTHTNDTMGAVRRQIIQRLKANPNNVRLELFCNGEVVEPMDDRKTLAFLDIKDKSVLSAKICQVGGNLASSPDSSSDSSTSSPRHHHYEGPNLEMEHCLPGVIISKRKRNCEFLLQLAHLGSTMKNLVLQDAARAVLKLIPADVHTVEHLRNHCREVDLQLTPIQIWENIFFSVSPSQTLYNLEVCYSLLMPGQGTLSEKTADFQLSFVKAKGISAMTAMLTRNNFLNEADLVTKRSAYLILLKICKLVLAIAGNSLVHMVAEACLPDSTVSVTASVHNQAVVLQQALAQIPSLSHEIMIRNVAQRLAPQLLESGANSLPDQNTVRAIIRIAWSAGAGNFALMNALPDEVHSSFQSASPEPSEEDVDLCREALEVLTLALALHPSSFEGLGKDKSWHNFIIDMVLLSNSRLIRMTAAEQFILIATRCSAEPQPLKLFLTLLFTVLETKVNEFAIKSAEYFFLLTRLLSFASTNNIPVPSAEGLLKNEIKWLKNVKDTKSRSGVTDCDDNLLEGHLSVCRELLAFMSPEMKFEIGSSNKSGIHLVRDIIDEFIFPASKMIVIFRQTGEIPLNQVQAIAQSPPTVMAAFDLLVGLCTGCPANLKLVANILTEMFYTDKDDVLTDWEYLPPIGPRPNNGFVGLKNAGATCYMNSVLQQLFMIDGIREGILTAEGACNDPEEDFSTDERDDDHEEIVEGEQNREYKILILKQVQAIFAHLAYTKQQFYIPRGLWKHFRMRQGEPVNLREQQDALEFFMQLLNLVDEALQALGYEQRIANVLGGLYLDQKICKTCPHRYSREQSFNVISVDIKNFSNLSDSLHEYVKGELLDGSNAYYCERCDKKVDTIKRLCVKKLSPILVIQLKRFDYDYERDCAIKFNDYFEFPRDLDMEPYTAAGLAKIEGEPLECDPDDLEGQVVRQYRLRGMVVHSGQASGGHYYSYIQCKGMDGQFAWFKFDDGEVTEIKMEDDEELKAQCYGGDYMSEVFDPMAKRMTYRKQKRWWNAYMLFYTRADLHEASVAEQMAKQMSKLTISAGDTNMPELKKGSIPLPIEKSIQKQNVKFLHHRNQYNHEFFQFMRKIINCNAHLVTPSGNGTPQIGLTDRLSSQGEDLSMTTMQLAAKFLFCSGFRTKKTLRGPAQEWYEALTPHLRYSRQVRLWFCQNMLFAQPTRFCEYILECPSAEVRTAFVRIIVFVAHFSLNDGPCPSPQFLKQISNQLDSAGNTLSDHLLQTVLALLTMEASEHGRHLPQYFTLFVMYASLGVQEKSQLLRLNIPATFIKVALDEGPGPPIKYQYTELQKLYQVVSQLIRCCDVTSKCRSAFDGKSPLPNPYVESSCPNGKPILPIQPIVYDLVFVRVGYLKKLIEEAHGQEDTKKLLLFCSWENPVFSHAVLHELLWQVAIAYTHELRPYLDLLYAILLMEDSWQNLRIQKALRGILDDQSAKEGLFETIQRSKTHYQKRAYQCIKLLVQLFTNCPLAKELMETSVDIKQKWAWSVDWLNDELENRGRPGLNGGSGAGPSANSQYSYTNWSPPAQSNDIVSGYFLERSHSARLTLQKALELLPEDDRDPSEEARLEEAQSETLDNEDAVEPLGLAPTPLDATPSIGRTTSPLAGLDKSGAPPSDMKKSQGLGDGRSQHQWK